MTGAAPARGVLRPGDRVVFDGTEHTVVGLSGTSVRLVSDDGSDAVIALAHLQAAADFAVGSGGAAAVGLPALGLLDAVPPPVLERARWWERHIIEVETGQPPEGDGPPRCGYDPAVHTLAQREEAKAAELRALGERASRATIRRQRHAYRTAGLWGLVDHRRTRISTPTGRVDHRVVAAARQAIAEETSASTGTRGRLRLRVDHLLAAEHGPGCVALPPKTTFYRVLAALEGGRHTFGAATTRRSLANRPEAPFGSVRAARPGELVQIDTTPLDVMAVLDDGVTGRVELTMLVDLATRTICSGVLRPHGTKAVDAALLLARAVVPEPMRPGWPEALRMRASRLPHLELAAVDARLADAAAKPVIVPETIVCDRGAVYLSETFLGACARLGISVQPAHPYTPTDKAVVERTFSSINTLFCQYVAGYTGRDVTHRGRDVDEQAVWSIGELQDLFDQWVLAGWQPRPHEGLRHPDLTRAELSPNEMYAALVAAAGYLPLALSGQDYLELLPVAWRRITAEGIRLGYLTYDTSALNPYRGQPSPITTKGGRWEVHYDPYDLSRVWLRPHQDQNWITVPWIHHGQVAAPFADFTLRHVRRLLTTRGQDQNQVDIAAALTNLLDHAGTGPDNDRATRRVVAKTRAAAATSPRPPTEPDATTAIDTPPPKQTDDGVDDDPDQPMAVVIPFGVFDARAEAERFW
ncbi:MAG: Mu transposase C-terminal domain-containing protein [Pseudonocardiales bacterium]